MKIKIETFREFIGGVESKQQWQISFKEGTRTNSFRLTPEEMFDLEYEVKKNAPKDTN